MATIRHHTHINRSADDVWKTVSDGGGIANWFPGIDTAKVEGKVRTISMGGTELVEDIVTVDGDLRRFQYQISGGVPLEFHLGTVDVLPDGEGSLVIYSTEVQPDEAKQLLDPVLARAVEGLKEHLEG